MILKLPLEKRREWLADIGKKRDTTALKAEMTAQFEAKKGKA